MFMDYVSLCLMPPSTTEVDLRQEGIRNQLEKWHVKKPEWPSVNTQRTSLTLTQTQGTEGIWWENTCRGCELLMARKSWLLKKLQEQISN